MIAGHAQSTTTYRFYEEVDIWLGPWGQQGYPIAYGKFYNVAFTTNQKLMANPVARDWVWRATILLQEALRNYVVGRIRDCTLQAITERELRQAAFDSHPAAYDMAGLATLTLVAPELIPVIATIPGREFFPTSDNFGPTIKQALDTLGRILPQMVGGQLAAIAGPAHTGILGIAAQRDRRHLLDEIALSRKLSAIRVVIERGELDYIPVLDQLIAQLNVRQFPDQGFARTAQDVIQAAQARRQRLLQDTNHLLQQSPAVRSRVESVFPNFLGPAGR